MQTNGGPGREVMSKPPTRAALEQTATHRLSANTTRTLPLAGEQNGPVTDAAERLRRRYPPPRVPRAVWVVLVAAGTALGLAWLVWAALAHATPAVSAQVSSFEIVSDTAMKVTVTVQRSDPSVAATCRVIAQSPDFQPVAEQEVPVEAGTVELVDVPVVLTTLRRATSASVSGCQTG